MAMSATFEALPSPSVPPTSQPSAFTLEPTEQPVTLRAGPGTAIWRKAGHNIDKFNAPHRLSRAMPLSSFSRARVTISACWRARHDNAGLVMVFSDARQQHLPSVETRRWVFAGIGVQKEQAMYTPHLVVTSCESLSADWSVYPMDGDDKSGNETTVEVRIEKDVNGHTLWVYYLTKDDTGAVKRRHPLRELSWMFMPGWEAVMLVQVGIYCAQPIPSEMVDGNETEATFSNLQIDNLE